MIKKATIFCAVIIIAALTSCVPARLLDESKAKLNECETERSALKKATQENDAKIAELKEQMVKNEKENIGLKRDTSIIGSNYRNLTSKYDKLNQLNEQLMDRLNKLLSGSEKDNSKLSGDLQMTQEQLLKKQDELKALEAKLLLQRLDLEALSAELKKREARVNELEAILKKKDQAAADLRKKLSDALLGFENKGLTITQKNGKVYVSLDESLLFASGKTNVEARGVEALKNVAKVLEQNEEINVLVEGHTDDVPMKGAGEIKDNWDLSVMRATSVTKILLSSAKIESQRITAAGRGEFFPLDPAKTAEARKKNRRTEIILTPKLDELLKVLGDN
ncbi:MAG: OmpA family protein [Bacteroidota bacterium]|nr:OmpA family protein [Bacteroidota bacterium]MDP3146873.1 OmpA family protein [Bacteroidota bacterium]